MCVVGLQYSVKLSPHKKHNMSSTTPRQFLQVSFRDVPSRTLLNIINVVRLHMDVELL